MAGEQKSKACRHQANLEGKILDTSQCQLMWKILLKYFNQYCVIRGHSLIVIVFLCKLVFLYLLFLINSYSCCSQIYLVPFFTYPNLSIWFAAVCNLRRQACPWIGAAFHHFRPCAMESVRWNRYCTSFHYMHESFDTRNREHEVLRSLVDRR